MAVFVEVKPSLESFASDNHPEQTFLKVSSHVLAMGLCDKGDFCIGLGQKVMTTELLVGPHLDAP